MPVTSLLVLAAFCHVSPPKVAQAPQHAQPAWMAAPVSPSGGRDGRAPFPILLPPCASLTASSNAGELLTNTAVQDTPPVMSEHYHSADISH